MFSRGVKIWLLVGLICVVIQVIVGGITRLTESGLSITEWEPVAGVLPPLDAVGWEQAFEKYKETPQYTEVNEGMTLEDFKFIYFWEFVHRQWARIMGLIFLFPFLYFLFRKKLSPALVRKLGIVIFFAGLAAVFGWIMVASGLIERPWVNAYKLSVHLAIAFCVFIALLYAYKYSLGRPKEFVYDSRLRRMLFIFLGVLWIQLLLGGMMSGMRIGVLYPTWPDMNGEFIPQVLFQHGEYNYGNLMDYDRNEWMPALVQFAHRIVAYTLCLFGIFVSYTLWKTRNKLFKKQSLMLVTALGFQTCLGILTVVNCIGEIPVFWGVMHQGGALILFAVSYWIYINFALENNWEEADYKGN